VPLIPVANDKEEAWDRGPEGRFSEFKQALRKVPPCLIALKMSLAMVEPPRFQAAGRCTSKMDRVSGYSRVYARTNSTNPGEPFLLRDPYEHQETNAQRCLGPSKLGILEPVASAVDEFGVRAASVAAL
jgi:hypothetical protein